MTVTLPAHLGRPEIAWLEGTPMDPAAIPAEPLPALAGCPFLYPGAAALVTGPTGAGRSFMMQACLFDAAQAGLRCAYLGSEVTVEEFNARATELARVREQEITEDLRAACGLVRYLEIFDVVPRAWAHPQEWAAGMRHHYDVMAIDPLSAIGSALELNFDGSNAEFASFFDRLVRPLTGSGGLAVTMLENVGHALDARERAKGASAKQDRADLVLSCKLLSSPPALSVRLTKVRAVRAPFRRGDEWIIRRDSQRIERHRADRDGMLSERAATLVEPVFEFVYENPATSKRALRDAIKGRNEHVDAALAVLVEEERVTRNADGYHAAAGRAPRTSSAPTVPTGTVPTVPAVPHTVPEACPKPHGASVPTCPTLIEGWARGTRTQADDDEADAELDRIRRKFGEETL